MARITFRESYARSIMELCNLCAIRRLSGLPGGRTLVLSPHYDDDVIGAGGTIMVRLSGGNPVMVVYLTDGREGIPKLKDKGQVERIRRRESARALEILGVSEFAHLSAPETRLRPTGLLLRKLAAMIESFSPELILVPWFFDNHVDHVEANIVLFRIAKDLGDDILIAGYEVWTPLTPNLYIDITEFAREKSEALLSFKSQLEQVDYLRTSMAISRRRALEAGIRGHGEAFLCLHAGEYFGWMRKTGIASMRF